MLVKLARNWFDPAGSLRETRLNPHDVPDEWKGLLPRGADIVDDKGAVISSKGGEDDKVLDELSKKPSETKTDATKK